MIPIRPVLTWANAGKATTGGLQTSPITVRCWLTSFRARLATASSYLRLDILYRLPPPYRRSL